ncbi:MAG: sodium:proton antiporter, partial [Methylococcales bacterium]
MHSELAWVLPFIFLLVAIAVLPLHRYDWWEKNYPWISLGLAIPVAFHYLIPLVQAEVLLHTAHEYISFICLIGSLFVVSGGIHIQVKGEATPLVNVAFLFVGAVSANFLGTTGASMVLVRPWLRMNKYRLTEFHTVFFIFIVSNIGGALTPIGDPPLFLGYLKGIPFFWVLRNIWEIWFIAIGWLLAFFFVLDWHNFKKAPPEIRKKQTFHEEWKFQGTHNLLFLALIIGSVFIEHPLYLREVLMVLAAVLSYKATARPIHQSNDFHFAPIREVAILFAGIFVTMIPALHWFESHASEIGIHTAGQFYWWSGALSSALDNAPTYLNFLSVAVGLFEPGESAEPHAIEMLLSDHSSHVLAISVAAVFFGAFTYIGNGPNFLVKSIAERSKAQA